MYRSVACGEMAPEYGCGSCQSMASTLHWRRLLLVSCRLMYCLLMTAGVAGQDSSVSDNSTAATSRAPAPAEGNPSELVCPVSPMNRPLFTLTCKTDDDCKILGEQCCRTDGKLRCRKGIPKPQPTPNHQPFLGVFTRECPQHPIPEPLPIKNCTQDKDCWPRICCPDGHNNYCRTPLPKWEETPRLEPLRNMVAYLQCTPPPPVLFDLFPRPCRNIVDCFPNLCCQEKEKKVCRPAKKSMLALLAQVSQRIATG